MQPNCDHHWWTSTKRFLRQMSQRKFPSPFLLPSICLITLTEHQLHARPLAKHWNIMVRKTDSFSLRAGTCEPFVTIQRDKDQDPAMCCCTGRTGAQRAGIYPGLEEVDGRGRHSRKASGERPEWNSVPKTGRNCMPLALTSEHCKLWVQRETRQCLFISTYSVATTHTSPSM